MFPFILLFTVERSRLGLNGLSDRKLEEGDIKVREELRCLKRWREKTKSRLVIW